MSIANLLRRTDWRALCVPLGGALLTAGCSYLEARRDELGDELSRLDELVAFRRGQIDGTVPLDEPDPENSSSTNPDKPEPGRRRWLAAAAVVAVAAAAAVRYLPAVRARWALLVDDLGVFDDGDELPPMTTGSVAGFQAVTDDEILQWGVSVYGERLTHPAPFLAAVRRHPELQQQCTEWLAEHPAPPACCAEARPGPAGEPPAAAAVVEPDPDPVATQPEPAGP